PPSPVLYTLSLHDALPILRRGLAIDSTVDIFTFYVPHRHVYGEQWIKFMKDGVNATPLPTVNTTGYIDHAAFLGTINPDTNKIPDRKSGSAGMPRPISYAVFCLKKKFERQGNRSECTASESKTGKFDYLTARPVLNPVH